MAWNTQLAAELESVAAQLVEMEEEQGGEDGAFNGFDKINKASVNDRLREIGDDPDASEEIAVLRQWLTLNGDEAHLKKRLKDAEADLDAKAYAHYPKLAEAEIKALVVDDKWLAALDRGIHGEMDRASQQLTQRVKDWPNVTKRRCRGSRSACRNQGFRDQQDQHRQGHAVGTICPRTNRHSRNPQRHGRRNRRPGSQARQGSAGQAGHDAGTAHRADQAGVSAGLYVYRSRSLQLRQFFFTFNPP